MGAKHLQTNGRKKESDIQHYFRFRLNKFGSLFLLSDYMVVET
jgi:hypothetical protein